MSIRLVVFLALVTNSAQLDAAPVLITKDNYKSAADSPFDLSKGFLEDFDDGLANTPGLVPPSSFGQIVAGGLGSGKAMEPTSVQMLLDGSRNITSLGFEFEAPYPTQVGFVTTQAAFPDIEMGIGVLPGITLSGDVSFAPNRFFGVTDPDGIQAIVINMLTPVPGQPFFQIDHLQYVPEPSSPVMLIIGVVALLILGRR